MKTSLETLPQVSLGHIMTYLPSKEIGILYVYGLNRSFKQYLREYCDIGRLITERLYRCNVHFDADRKADHVRVDENTGSTATWTGCDHGSIYGDQSCLNNGISYWEITGAQGYTFIGIAQDIQQIFGFRTGMHYESNAYLSANPGCNQVPGIMYSSAGFVTNGAFRGPKPRLPGSVKRLSAAEYLHTDTVGVFVNLCDGYLIFLVNNMPQTFRIPIDPTKEYFPFISDTSCDQLSLTSGRDHPPPWDIIFNY